MSNLKVVGAAIMIAMLPRATAAHPCGSVRFIGNGTHQESKDSIVEFPIFVYQDGDHRAVVLKQDMRVNADGAVRSYAVDGHGFSYLCDGLMWKSPDGFTFEGDCPKKAAEAMRMATEDGDFLQFSSQGPTLCVFGFHVEGGKTDDDCGGRVVGGGAGGKAPLVRLGTPPETHTHFVATTAVKNDAEREGTPAHEIDSAAIPFIVRPRKWSEKFPDAAFELRDYAYVYSPGALGIPHETVEGARGVFALVADSGPAKKFGEGSLALHQYIAFGEVRAAPAYVPTAPGSKHPDADKIFHPYLDKRDGDVRAKANIDRELWYVIFPGSADDAARARHTYARANGEVTGNIHENGSKAAQGMGGIEAVISCLARDEVFLAHDRRQQ